MCKPNLVCLECIILMLFVNYDTFCNVFNNICQYIFCQLLFANLNVDKFVYKNFGQMSSSFSVWENYDLGKWRFGQMRFWANDVLGKWRLENDGCANDVWENVEAPQKAILLTKVIWYK